MSNMVDTSAGKRYYAVSVCSAFYENLNANPYSAFQVVFGLDRTLTLYGVKYKLINEDNPKFGEPLSFTNMDSDLYDCQYINLRLYKDLKDLMEQTESEIKKRAARMESTLLKFLKDAVVDFSDELNLQSSSPKRR